MHTNIHYSAKETENSESIKRACLNMKYKKQIDPELRRIAKKVPYHKLMIRGANLFQIISFHFTRIPNGTINRSITIKGYKGRDYRVELFEPYDVLEKLPCLIYVHGGAFSYKASAYHKKLACMYAEKAKCRVFVPDYHLLPRYPFPAAYDDVLALYKNIMENVETYGIDNEKIGIAGDSAGASIAALLCNNHVRENLTRPCMQMLVYPVTDINMQTDSMVKFTDTPLWNAKNNKRMWQYYCKNLNVANINRASPMHSELPRILPDTYIETAEYDCLHDEGILYGKKLQEAGANVEINETRGTIHGYDSAITADIAICNINKRIQFIKEKFHHCSSN